MITSIKKLKGFGVFGGFDAPASLPPFKQFNVVYGDNGSGKTTLSRLLKALENGDDPEYPELEYTVTTDVEALNKGQKYSRKIRVFNSEYVDENIGQFDGPIRHILIVGRENRVLAEQIRSDQALLDARNANVELEAKALEKLELDKGKIFSAVAKTIGEATSGGSTLRSYRKPDAESSFDKLTDFETLSDQTLAVHRQTVRQEQGDLIATVKEPSLDANSASTLADSSESFRVSVESLTERTAQAGALSRLTANPELSTWVETGLHIHLKRSSATCEFCDQALPASRMRALAEHFGAEDQKLKLDIEQEMATGDRISNAISSIALPAKAAFYTELRDEYELAVRKLERERRAALDQLAVLQEILELKLAERSVSYKTTAPLVVSRFVEAVNEVADIVARHNAKTNAFEAEKAAARAALEKHYLSAVAEQVKEYAQQIDDKKALLRKLRDGDPDSEDQRSLEALSRAITENKAKVSEAHAGGAEMTELLSNFLGRTDISFESNDEGYYVRRRGKPAKRLSEGEKTAIAFIYFIVQLADQDFDLADGIVVIDDPVSSLDSSALYQAFAYLKEAVKDARQVFLLTHNFEFLKLLINWLDNIPKKNQMRAYFMLICAETEAGRESRIEALDALLVEHPSEYHFLFKQLITFKSDGTILSCYHIPNIARKVLETFLEFHVPSSGSLYAKLEATDFDSIKKTAIYKFANTLSHRTGKGFDPALVAETQKNTAYLLEMIKTVAPLHYEGLEKLAVE